MRNIQGDEQF